MIRKAKLIKKKNGKFEIKLVIDLGERVGKIEFQTVFPCDMEHREADSRLIVLASILGFDRPVLPYEEE